MRSRRIFWLATVVAGFCGVRPGLAQEMPNMPAMKEQQRAPQQHGAMQHPGGMQMHGMEAVYPRMGRAQERTQGKLFTLDEAQQIAREKNPTLRQAEAEIRATKAREQQAGLYPNPTVGYTGDEIRGGSVNGGKQGFFVQQNIVMGGKLQRERDVFTKEQRIAEAEAEEQKLRLESAVKTAFLRVLAAQELLDVRSDLAKIENEYAESLRRLFNTGQEDESELLEAEVDAERIRISQRMQENALREEWRSLAAVIGKPAMEQETVAGDLEQGWPEVNETEILDAIAAQSPAARIADASMQRALAQLALAKRESIPDLQVRVGMEYNREPLAADLGVTGWEGIAEVGVQLPIFNRNQGNVAAAAAERENAELEKQRIALTLRERAATVVDRYANAKVMALAFREEILPRARKAYGLLVEKYGLMMASSPRVTEAQRKLYELQAEYIATLENVWTTGIALQGYLLTDGLEAPARPGDVDRPMRETNVPMPERMQAPQ